MTGHITTSALVLDFAADKVLLIHHKLYDKWLQPGGHFEEDCNSIWESALREAVEETSVSDARLHLWNISNIPFDIDTHDIAAQAKKNEGDHFHHDFIYLFTADSTLPLTPQQEEVFGAKWIDVSELGMLPHKRFARILAKLKSKGIIG